MYVFGSGQRGWRGGEWMRGLGLGFPILWEQGECWTCVCFGCGGVSGVGGEWVGLGPGSGVLVLCLCEL